MDLPNEIVDQFNAAIKPPVNAEALKALYAQNVDFFTQREDGTWISFKLLNKIETQALEKVFSILMDVIYIPAYIHLYTSSGFDDAKDYFEALFDKVDSDDILCVDLLTKFMELTPFDEKYLEIASTNHLFAKIYYDPITRQNDFMSCQIFALQAAKEFHTMHRYLPKQYQGDLFLYLAEQAKSMAGYNPDNENMHNLSKITFTRLPPRMIRSMQSTTLYQERESKPSSLSSYGLNENVLPVNKRGERPVQSAQKYFLVSQELNKLQNRRIDAKFYSMFELVDRYLRMHAKNEMEIAKSEFTLQSFFEQFAPKSKPPANRKGKRD